YTLNAADQLVSQGSLLVTESYRYNQVGQQTAVLNALGEATTIEQYDLAGNLVVLTQNGVTTKYAYDAQGRQVALKDANGNLATWTYDADGRLASSTDNDGTVTTYIYDRNGALTQQTNTRGQNLQYTYDGAG